MSRFDLSDNEQAVLELIALKPVQYFPTLPLAIVRKLRRRGLTVRDQGCWYLTRAGFEIIGRTLH